MRPLRPFMLLSAALACTGPGLATPTTCGRKPPAGAQPFQVAAVEELAGEYDVTLVDTANARPPARAYRIHLEVTDSTRRFRSAGTSRGARHLTGWVLTSDSTPRARLMRSRDPDRPGIAWFGERTLSIGDNVSVLDGWGADVLQAGWQSAAAFGGTWHWADPGLEIVVSTDGRSYQTPAGYFCARRLSASR